MLKNELRKLYKEKRCNISSVEMRKLDDLLLIQFQKLDIFIPSYILTYAAFEKFNEFDPTPITDYCYFKNPTQHCLYPVIDLFENKMEAILVNDDTVFETNKWGIAEPIDGVAINAKEIELVLVPLLCFDKKGYRVGYGKGYYDKFLANCHPNTLKIGFSYFEPIDTITDTDGFDIKLDICVTPTQNFIFK
jgi:5-formyltetrahydrofolate cyclo-ligase